MITTTPGVVMAPLPSNMRAAFRTVALGCAAAEPQAIRRDTMRTRTLTSRYGIFKYMLRIVLLLPVFCLVSLMTHAQNVLVERARTDRDQTRSQVISQYGVVAAEHQIG